MVSGQETEGRSRRKPGPFGGTRTRGAPGASPRACGDTGTHPEERPPDVTSVLCMLDPDLGCGPK